MPLLDLPTELLIDILGSTASFPDLRNLGCASRRIYAVFERDKAALMYSVLGNLLGPVLTEALVLWHAPHMVNEHDNSVHLNKVRKVVSLCGDCLRSGGCMKKARQLSLGAVLDLLKSVS
jgi:hypothetical protein